MSTKGSSAGISHLPLAVLSLAVLLFLSRGFLHVLVVPMWEGFDEPFHYTYVQYIAEHRTLPPLSAPSVSQEVLKSLQFFPTTYHLSHLSPMRNYLEVGTFSGLTYMRITSSLPLIAWINALPQLRLGQFGKLLFELHLWAGNWSFRMVSRTFYYFFAVLYALCGVGIIRLLLKNRSMLEQASDQHRECRAYLMTSIGLFLSFLAGMFYHRWSVTVAGLFVDRQWFGAIGSGGWYLNVLLPVEAMFLILGIRGLVGQRRSRVACLILLRLSITLDQVALWNREIPYYAGLSIRVAHPFANPVDAVKHVAVSLALAFRRVTFLGPHWSSEGLLLSLVMLTLGITAVTLGLVRRRLS